MIRKSNITIIIVTLICTLLNFSCKADSLNNKENAKSKFLQATSKLYETGGIGTFETPSSDFDFHEPKDRSDELSPQEVKQILNESIKGFNEAIVLDPSLKEVYYFLGVAYLKLQDIDSAIRTFKKAVEVEPQREITYYLLYGLLVDSKNFKEAHAVADKFLKQFPQKEKKINIFNLIAIGYYQEGDYKNAIKIGKEMISIDDQRIEGHLTLAHSYYMIGNIEDSEKEFKKVVEIDPNMEREVENMKALLKSKKEN